ncbi:MAG: PrgI family protein [Candidatus Paceibacterota bacterium]|jgi:membrane-bound ClpP family serine protease
MADYQVPQFIEDESRLIGPFTLTQISILVVGGGSAFIVFKLFKPFIGIPLTIIILFITGLLAFSRMNDMPLYKMIIPMIKHFVLPKSYQ